MRIWVTWVMAGVLVGCGGAPLPGPGTTPGDPPKHEETTAESLWPLTAGSTWTYRIEDPLNGTFEKIVTVEGLVKVPGSDADAVRVRSVQPHLEEVSYQVVSEGIVYRVREEDFRNGQLLRVMLWNPAVMKSLAEAKDPGWTNSTTVVESELDGTNTVVDEKEKIFAWSVASVGETIATDAGTFSNAVKLERVREDKDTYQRAYWLVPGVGKVYETGERTERLLRYEVK